MHANLPILSKLSEVGGKLFYNGAQVSEGGTTGKRTYLLNTATQAEKTGAYVSIDKSGLPEPRKVSLDSLGSVYKKLANQATGAYIDTDILVEDDVKIVIDIIIANVDTADPTHIITCMHNVSADMTAIRSLHFGPLAYVYSVYYEGHIVFWVQGACNVVSARVTVDGVDVNRILSITDSALPAGYTNSKLFLSQSVRKFYSSADFSISNYYTKTQVDFLLSGITIDLSGYYTALQIDGILDSYYTIEDIEDLIADFVTSAELTTALGNKAEKAGSSAQDFAVKDLSATKVSSGTLILNGIEITIE